MSPFSPRPTNAPLPVSGLHHKVRILNANAYTIASQAAASSPTSPATSLKRGRGQGISRKLRGMQSSELRLWNLQKWSRARRTGDSEIE